MFIVKIIPNKTPNVAPVKPIKIPIVKNIFKKGNLSGEIEKDFYGNVLKDMKEINRKVVVASDEEKKAILSNWKKQ